MSKAGYPYDNAPMGRYFNTLKNKCTNLYEFRTEEELYRTVEEFAYVFYNHVRPHSYNGYQTPFEARCARQRIQSPIACSKIPSQRRGNCGIRIARKMIFLATNVTKKLDHYNPPRNRWETELAFLRRTGQSCRKRLVSHHCGDGKSIWSKSV